MRITLDKTKTVVLGYNSEDDKYCILLTGFPWEFLTENLKYLDSVRFTLQQVNWGGMDCIESVYKVLKENHLDIGENKIILPEPLIFRGTDYDMGREEKWSCSVDTLIETKCIQDT